MYLIQVLLPRAGRDGRPVDNALYAATRAELIEQFQGATAYLRSPALGAWTAPDGSVEGDEMLMVEVLAATFDRPWWEAYAGRLATRFGQQEMHIRALPAETL